ncbi:MAG TPA: DUF420 domain-containing protein [Kiritimatiellia bacterium]|nr:DUF420 domain-containing protein [Kiritimatiellia bacterium]
MLTLSDLPTLNATLNGMATILLFQGWRAIRAGKPEVHKKYMVGAFVMSALFLTSYLIYHYNAPAMTIYEGQGVDRWIYYTILFTHIPLAIFVVPGCLAALYFAFTGKLDRHVKVVKWLWPVWMYVSVTGVLIYLMLYVF